MHLFGDPVKAHNDSSLDKYLKTKPSPRESKEHHVRNNPHQNEKWNEYIALCRQPPPQWIKAGYQVLDSGNYIPE